MPPEPRPTAARSTGSALYRGGFVYSPQDPFATALVVAEGEVAWVGSEEAADAHADSVDEVVQLDGALVTPTFVDAHVHTLMTGQALDGVDLSQTQSLTEALRLVETAARYSRGRPVYAHSWDETRWPEGRPATHEEVDRATHGAVVYMPRIDSHSATVSSALADAAGVRDLDGWDGHGLVLRDAHHAVRDTFAANITAADRRYYIDLAMRVAAEAGVGLVHEMSAPHIGSPDELADVVAAGDRGDGPQVMPYWGQLASTEDEARGLVERLGVLGLAGDLCADGSFGSHTAHVTRPYEDDPGSTGFGYLGVEQIRDHVAACSRVGVQAGFHVIGDAGLRDVVTGMRAAAEVVGADRVRRARHRLEHAEHLTPQTIAALVELGVHASVQPAFDAFWGGTEGMYAVRLGPERALALNPFATMTGEGMGLALGSDTPVTPFAPWEAIRACVNHHNPAQRISARSAFLAHTRGGWRAGRIDDRGYLGLGQPASFAVWQVGDLVVQAPDDRIQAWSTDPRSGTPGLPDLSPGAPAPVNLRTVVRGRTVFDRAGALA
ncbi:MAG TPA: amidohydrolase family protein [Segeticoccus sp.]|nr:amidohydrolase family protein [Segeticoccus sp.]